MEPTVDDLREFKRLLAAGSTPYVEEVIKKNISELEEKFRDAPKKVEKKPEEHKPAAPAKPTHKSQAISSYAFLDSGKTAKIIVKNIDGLENAKIEFYPEDHGFVLYILREEQNMPNLRLGISPTKKIVPEECKYVTKGTQITVILKKKKDAAWSKLQKPYVAPKAKDEEASPADPSNMMDMLRKMYDDASDEEKRNLNKAAWEGRQKRMQKEMDDI